MNKTSKWWNLCIGLQHNSFLFSPCTNLWNSCICTRTVTVCAEYELDTWLPPIGVFSLGLKAFYTECGLKNKFASTILFRMLEICFTSSLCWIRPRIWAILINNCFRAGYWPYLCSLWVPSCLGLYQVFRVIHPCIGLDHDLKWWNSFICDRHAAYLYWITD